MVVQSSSKLCAKMANFHHLNQDINKSRLKDGFASSSSTGSILSVPNSWSYRQRSAPSPNSKEKSSKSKLSWNNTTRQSQKTPPCLNELYAHTRWTWGTMALYVPLRLTCKGVLTKLLLKCKKSVLTPIITYCQKLTISRSLTCCVHVLLCTLMSKFIICGMPLVSKLTEQCIKRMLKQVKWSKKLVCFHPLFDYNFLEFSNP